MPYPQPGQTFRLVPPWTEGGTWPFSGLRWSASVPGQLSASENSPQGWAINVVAGSYGSPDLVVDVTTPVSQGSFQIGSGLYDVCASFYHGQAGSLTYSKQFGFSYAELTSPNLPAFEVVLHPVSQVLFSALVEPGGLRFYRANLRSGFTSRTALDLIERADLPQLWLDDHGYLYVCARQRDTPCGPSAWRLWKSCDSGQTWSQISTLPFDDAYGLVRARGGAKNIIVAYAPQIVSGQIGPGHVARSFDDGATWEEPVAIETIYGGSFARIEPIPDGRGHWHAAGFGVPGGGFMLSSDLGRTWNLLPGNPAAPSPRSLGYVSPANVAGKNIWMMAGIMGTTSASAAFPALAGKLAFSRSHDRGQIWQPPTLIADDPSQNVTALGESPTDGLLYATNGRDRLYLSRNSGQTWSDFS